MNNFNKILSALFLSLVVFSSYSSKAMENPKHDEESFEDAPLAGSINQASAQADKKLEQAEEKKEDKPAESKSFREYLPSFRVPAWLKRQPAPAASADAPSLATKSVRERAADAASTVRAYTSQKVSDFMETSRTKKAIAATGVVATIVTGLGLKSYFSQDSEEAAEIKKNDSNDQNESKKDGDQSLDQTNSQEKPVIGTETKVQDQPKVDTSKAENKVADKTEVKEPAKPEVKEESNDVALTVKTEEDMLFDDAMQSFADRAWRGVQPLLNKSFIGAARQLKSGNIKQLFAIARNSVITSDRHIFDASVSIYGLNRDRLLANKPENVDAEEYIKNLNALRIEFFNVLTKEQKVLVRVLVAKYNTEKAELEKQ